ncbi:hypothetical protein [Streptomyces sp. NPDC006334]|uniref:hypothetical protein n=1 Tax=Streptomyces sp. NPDC006334 TaxID=3156754 RepID=UPI0033AFFE47
MNRFGTQTVAAFIATLFTGYVLILRPYVQVTVPPEAVYALGGLLSGTAFEIFRLRRHRR